MINLLALAGCAVLVAVSKVKLTKERKVFEELEAQLKAKGARRHIPKDAN